MEGKEGDAVPLSIILLNILRLAQSLLNDSSWGRLGVRVYEGKSISRMREDEVVQMSGIFLLDDNLNILQHPSH